MRKIVAVAVAVVVFFLAGSASAFQFEAYKSFFKITILFDRICDFDDRDTLPMEGQRVELYSARDSNNCLAISVIRDGRGIFRVENPEYFERERFFYKVPPDHWAISKESPYHITQSRTKGVVDKEMPIAARWHGDEIIFISSAGNYRAPRDGEPWYEYDKAFTTPWNGQLAGVPVAVKEETAPPRIKKKSVVREECPERDCVF